jgi:hypothetical protein
LKPYLLVQPYKHLAAKFWVPQPPKILLDLKVIKLNITNQNIFQKLSQFRGIPRPGS